MTTMLLSHERLAEAAGHFVVSNDVSDRTTPRLFGLVDPALEVSEEDGKVQIEDLFLRFLSQDPSEERVQEIWDLLVAVYEATSDPQQAWAAVVAALIRDPDFLFY